MLLIIQDGCMEDGFRIHELMGSALEPWLDALGELRIRVFREYPWLYSPDDDKRCSHDYHPLDGFWKSQGYQKHPILVARFPWKEIGEDSESGKSLTSWYNNGPIELIGPLC